MKSPLYSKFLVTLQFTIIGLMILFSNGLINSSLTLSIFILGGVIGLVALNCNKIGNFNIQPELKKDCQLITSGIYSYIRHPMYTSVIVMMLGILLTNFSFLEGGLFIGLIITLFLKASREEKLWINHHLEYQSYKDKTKFFIPFVL